MFSYDQLRFIWWLLIGVLMLLWAITDGFDIGVGILLKVIGKTDEERRIMINSVAPHWDGNQVWLVTSGGAMFAAWPIAYATAFSGFYLALMLVLMALFFRPMGFEYRSKIDSPVWRNLWDWGLVIGSLVPALVIGVAFGNLLQGVPFDFIPNATSANSQLANNINMPFYHGGFNGNELGGIFSGFIGLISLLNWYGLIAGLLSVFMLVAHGGAFLQLKTSDQIRARSEKATCISALLACFLFVVAGVLLYFFIDGYQVTSTIADNGLSTPAVNKIVESGSAFWFRNYAQMPWLYVFPLLGILGFLGAALGSTKHKCIFTFVSTSIAILGVVFTAGVSMFPFVIPSSTTMNHSLTIWDTTSSYGTLGIMTLVALVMTPVVLAYNIWGYYVMRGRVTSEYIRKNSNKLY
ncbi:MAG: cytochrome d ubiquinol oxidase subunit II [Neisseriaceae bacterium]|nr:MAG: cytochrome d ubiquinol oxidase subunit II [Neisseriaceae bacterium]